MLRTVPFDLQIPALGALLAFAAWIGLLVVGHRLPRGSLGRALMLRSRLSLAVTLLLGSLAVWLAALLGPELLPLPRAGTELGEVVFALGVVWTLLRCQKELRSKADVYSLQLFPDLEPRDRLFLLDVADKILSTTVVVIVVLEILRWLGTPVAVLLTAGGFGAAALGFGARTTVENMLSGISLYINRPFVIGDLIQIPAENITGTVEQISWFYTQLRDLERQPIFVPNGIFIAKPVINTGRIDSRRVLIEFGLSYGDRGSIQPIVTELEQVLQDDPCVDHAKPHVVHFVGYGESSLNLRLLCHCASGELLPALNLQQKLLLRIGEVVEAHRAAMPYPTRTLVNA